MSKKRCSKCKKRKLRSCFTKSKDRPDGLADQCKECKREYEREYKRIYRKGKVDVTKKQVAPTAGIDSLDQIDSVLREMAELQAGIDQEKATCEKRISLVREYTNETIEPWLSHQTALQALLLDFLKRNGEKTLTRKYRFGTICFSRGRLKIYLNVNLAKQNTEKP